MVDHRDRGVVPQVVEHQRPSARDRGGVERLRGSEDGRAARELHLAPRASGLDQLRGRQGPGGNDDDVCIERPDERRVRPRARPNLDAHANELIRQVVDDVADLLAKPRSADGGQLPAKGVGGLEEHDDVAALRGRPGGFHALQDRHR